MRAKRIIILICILSCVGFGIYIATGFYKIEHTYTEMGKKLITKTADMGVVLSENQEQFNDIVQQLSSDSMQDYYYPLSDGYIDRISELNNIDDFKDFRDTTGVYYIMLEPLHRNAIRFYQTADHSQYKPNEYPSLNFACEVQNDGSYDWTIENDSEGKKLFVHLYNLLYN